MHEQKEEEPHDFKGRQDLQNEKVEELQKICIQGT
jgi:hypothetical protein